ncbi:putative deoxyribonuclease, RhsC-like [Bacteroides thetaiotaomicron]|nr:putative deoxyribonuclease, RhsC-like [Bacteroides thetaiotaomicron]
MERILPGGVVRSFAYDDIGRLVDARTRKDSRTRHMRRYRWGVADRLLSVEDSRRGETRYSYTPTGQLDRAEYPDGREQWRKSDPVGNLYPDPDMRLRSYLSGGRLEQDGEWHCEYDGDGNLTERYLGTGKWLDGKKDRWRYRWNADGSLAKVVRPDKREVEFTYDALGRRLSKSFGTTVTRWVWNGNVPLHQWKQRREYSVMEDKWNTDTERRDMTVWLFDEESFVPVAMIKEGRSYSILTDQLGTPTEAYDAEGNEVWSRVLDMDGNVIEETGNKGMVPFLFQGQYYDRETGLAYNRFRYYDPKMGMYVSQDPIGLAGGILNLYGYVDDTNAWSDVLGLDRKVSILEIPNEKPIESRSGTLSSTNPQFSRIIEQTKKSLSAKGDNTQFYGHCAELNAIENALNKGYSLEQLKGSTITTYSTKSNSVVRSCDCCRKILNKLGISDGYYSPRKRKTSYANK